MNTLVLHFINHSQRVEYPLNSISYIHYKRVDFDEGAAPATIIEFKDDRTATFKSHNIFITFE